MTRVAFLLNGVGLGNATRCHAVIQRLVERGAEVEVFTCGNGAWYFRGRPEIAALHTLEQVEYAGNGRGIDMRGTLRASVAFVRCLARNARRVSAVLAERRFDVAVADSSYALWPLKLAGVPVVALNNSDVVFHEYRRRGDAPRATRAHFLAVEQLDYAFHRLVPDLVISPWIGPRAPVADNWVLTGPIVRRGYEAVPGEGPVRRVVIMLSGSTLATEVQLDRADHPFAIDVVGRGEPERPSPPHVRWHGKLADNRELLRAADLVVLNAGFSALSEVFAMRKPMVVVPVAGHAEQWVNARSVADLGVARIANGSDLERVMLEAAAAVPELRAAYARLPAMEDGAARAADAVLGLAQPDGEAQPRAAGAARCGVVNAVPRAAENRA